MTGMLSDPAFGRRTDADADSDYKVITLTREGDSYEKITRLFTTEASAEEIEEYLKETKIKV